MPGRGSGKRRGLAIAGIALTILMVAPELTPSVGATARTGISAATGRGTTAAELVAKRRRRRLTLAQRRALMARYLAAHPSVAAQYLAAHPNLAPKKTTVTRPAAKAPAQRKAAARAKARRAATARRALAKKRALARTRAAARRARRAAKPGSSSLSLPRLGLYAIAPFLLMGIYLLASDYLRRRTPRKRHASLVITRVSDR